MLSPLITTKYLVKASQMALVVAKKKKKKRKKDRKENLPGNAGDTSELISFPESGRSPGEETATHLSIVGLEYPVDRGAGYILWGHKESDTTEPCTCTHTRRHIHTHTNAWLEIASYL